LAECRGLGGCATGSAKITRGYKLKARHVIHAVGPVYRDGRHGEPPLLASAYRACLELASAHHCSSIAFPAISTGVYGYPVDQAAPIAFRTIVDYVDGHPEIQVVRYVLFDSSAFEAHRRALDEVLAK
jgi:O-acetyl-ADP-ribose deacetylase (regulator of RNase III)